MEHNSGTLGNGMFALIQFNIEQCTIFTQALDASSTHNSVSHSIAAEWLPNKILLIHVFHTQEMTCLMEQEIMPMYCSMWRVEGGGWWCVLWVR